MSLRDLSILYLLAGLACAVAVYRASRDRGDARRRAALSAALCVPLWPIWAPVALTAGRGAASDRPDGGAGTAAARVQGALREGVSACAGTSFEALLSREAAVRIEAEVARAAARHAELDALLRQGGFDEAAAAARVAEIERDGAGGRALATAHLHLENIRRLRAMRDHDARALEELADLVQALRTQLVLARFAGSSVEGVGGIVSEVWARVEGLGAAIDAHGGAGSEGPIAT
ncbi:MULTISPECIES: hypothetical protein [Sorangium]|uniref:Uncharacterized protein n=1 Tax=Sorangium cellulosum TaxID=56 RepID=A0A4P2QVD4_SORCE|nr:MULTISPECIES: hypothetical protein [Sorangium]AUX34128.1 hypothetical protein SOCE836_062960 [Sorangium cellulosum]WCQ93439.1 hypothetical protein NQZ70_06187 [Sorangium sp. Soce836]